MNELTQILIVDDHKEIRESLAGFLSRHGYRVRTAADGREMKRILKTGVFDLVVLDVMMPGDDGLTLCRHLREQGDLPVILLTALGEDTDRVVGLEMGADDYVVKPFNPRELLARIKAVLRRVQALPPEPAAPKSEQLRFDRWILDLGRRELVGEDGIVVALSATQFSLLRVFVSHPKMVLSRDQLLDLAQRRTSDGPDRSIDHQISRLRRKIERDPKEPALVKTVWGGGYAFCAEVKPV